jgi:hypothetical protein
MQPRRQVEVIYSTSLATPLNARKGVLMASAPASSLYRRDLGGTMRALAFNGNAQGLAGGSGGIVTIELRSTSKRRPASIARGEAWERYSRDLGAGALKPPEEGPTYDLPLRMAR